MSPQNNSHICDFCSGGDVRWAFPARDFRGASHTLPIELNSSGGWAACPACYTLIQAADRDGLCRRSAKLMVRMHPSLPHRIAMREIRDIHDQFWSNRLGPPVPADEHTPDPTRPT